MSRPRKQQSQVRESPIQFRPGAELGQLVASLAAKYGLQTPEACRMLIALAVTEMDSRFFGLMQQMAVAMGGENAFLHACVHVHTALQGARRATSSPLQREAERASFILTTVQDFLANKGQSVKTEGLWFLPDTPPVSEEPDPVELHTPKKRIISKKKMREFSEKQHQGVPVEESASTKRSPVAEPQRQQATVGG